MFKPSRPIPSSEITPEWLYVNRRKFIQLAATAGIAAAIAACGPANPTPPSVNPDAPATAVSPTQAAAGAPEKPNSYDEITSYNNFYEFSEGKEGIGQLASKFKTSPWQVQVSGLVNAPKTFGLVELLKFPQEERVYRLRCVEAWSMVIPWTGFPLNQILKAVEPKAEAKYVKFTTVYNPEELPGQRSSYYSWPYTEGLRLDEAMHDLTLVVTGLYGKSLPAQNGAPLRLAVPWKYGFKSIKSIEKIELVAEQPSTFWSTLAPNEYGFYSNVNPGVPHPRWSQASERRIGQAARQATLKFNGYEAEVASLYAGMNLTLNY
jgi:sulfoxide reductase catalytic subunit YedY